MAAVFITPTFEDAMSERKGHYMRTFTGRTYWPLDPRPEDVCIEDIAHALAHQARFNGMTQKYYSVAEHSVLCSLQNTNANICFELLMHDAAEAYTGDLIRPMKMIPEIRAIWTPIEEMNEAVLAARFGLAFPHDANLKAIIKKVDMEVCQAELEQLMHGSEPNSAALMEGEFTAAKITPNCMLPLEAKKWFLERFHLLNGKRFLNSP